MPRRAGHYGMRAALLGLLWTLGLTAWLATGGLGEDPQIGATARFGVLLFQVLTFVLVTLVTFFAALSAASTVRAGKRSPDFSAPAAERSARLRDRAWQTARQSAADCADPAWHAAGVGALLLLGGITPGQVVQAWLVVATSAWRPVRSAG